MKKEQVNVILVEDTTGVKTDISSIVSDNVPKCPKCGSTHIEATTRGYSGFWGFLGSGQTMNYCKSCGHKWNP